MGVPFCGDGGQRNVACDVVRHVEVRGNVHDGCGGRVGLRRLGLNMECMVVADVYVGRRWASRVWRVRGWSSKKMKSKRIADFYDWKRDGGGQGTNLIWTPDESANRILPDELASNAF